MIVQLKPFSTNIALITTMQSHRSDCAIPQFHNHLIYKPQLLSYPHIHLNLHKGAFTLEILIRITLIRISLIRIKFAFTLDKKLIHINLIRITLIRINFAFTLNNLIFRNKPERTCLSIRECVYKKFLLRLKSKSMMNVHFEMHDVRRNSTNCRDVIFQVITSHSHCRLKTEIIDWASDTPFQSIQ